MNSLNVLEDKYGRRMRKLRLSLMDACNFRCLYCMPDDIKFLQTKDILNAREFFDIAQVLCDLGIEELRLTGGEPLLHPDLAGIVSALGKLPWKKFGLTTNAFSLKQHLPMLKANNCHYLNISMDSLDRVNFNEIVRKEAFDSVMDSLLEAKSMGFSVKVNVVLMRGINDHELKDFVEFSALHQIEVRFLELMKIGVAIAKNPKLFVSAGEAITVLQTKYRLRPESTSVDSTSFNFKLDNGARIGFIASETQAFCGTCSRLRLSATGRLRSCLMSEAGLSLRDVPVADYPGILRQVISWKPNVRLPEIKEAMVKIGG